MSTPNNSDSDFWMSFQDSSSQNMNNNVAPRQPTSFMDLITPEASSIDFDSMASDLLKVTFKSNHPKAISFLTENTNLSVISIASGFTKEITHIHHLFQCGEQDKTYALSGFGKSANTVSLITSRLLNKTQAKVPSIEALKANLSRMTTAELDDDQLQLTEIPNSIILPPKLALELANLGTTSTKELFDAVISFVLREDDRLMQERNNSQPTVDGTRNLEDLPPWNNEAVETYSLLLQTLFHWNSLESQRSTATRLANDATASDYNNSLADAFSANRSALAAPSNPPEGVDPFTNIERQQPPPTTDTVNQNNLPGPTSNITEEQRNLCQALGLDERSLAIFSLFQSMLPRQQPNDNTSMATSVNKLSATLETFANATASQIRSKEKLPDVIKTAILNSMTTDGETPATDLTDSMKSITSGSEENASTLLKVILKKHHAASIPNPRFNRAARKGLWTFPTGNPDNVCILNLCFPTSDDDAMDYAKLKEEESNGRNMTEQERDFLYGKRPNLSKTLNHLLMKLDAWAVLAAELYGPHSLVAMEAESWKIFVSQNMIPLMSRKAQFDNDLPARLESIHAESFNEFFTEAQTSVPSSEILNGDSQRQAILRGQIKPDLSKSIQEILRPTPKGNDRKRRLSADSITTPRKRRNSGMGPEVTHSNQPNEFKVSSEKFTLAIYPAVKNNQVSVPKCPSTDSTECCRFIFLGKCNSDCPRAAAHSNPSGNKSRMQNLRRLLSDCLSAYKANKRPSDPDFD